MTVRIALDAMGTDLAPQSEVAGAIRALEELEADIEVVLVGDEAVIRPELDKYEPVPELTDCFYTYYGAIEDPGGYFAAHNAAGERTALHMLEEAAAFARAGGNNRLARFAERIIPEERLHVRLGEEILAKYAVTEEDQTKLEKYFRDGLETHWNYTEGVYRKIAAMEA